MIPPRVCVVCGREVVVNRHHEVSILPHDIYITWEYTNIETSNMKNTVLSHCTFGNVLPHCQWLLSVFHDRTGVSDEYQPPAVDNRCLRPIVAQINDLCWTHIPTWGWQRRWSQRHNKIRVHSRVSLLRRVDTVSWIFQQSLDEMILQIGIAVLQHSARYSALC